MPKRSTQRIRASLAGCLTIASFAACQGEIEGRVPEDVTVEDLPNPYATTLDWGRLPEGREWGQVSAINIDNDGRHIWVADRCGMACTDSPHPAVLRFDPSGNVVASFGTGLFLRPHGIHVDSDGNIWVTDVRGPTAAEMERSPEGLRKGHVVLKFSPAGEILLTLGTPGEAGAPPTHLDQPNDVITAPNGDIFVAEGHSNTGETARISKYSSDGTFIKSFGRPGSGPGEFRTPHGLAFDSQGRLFVADRGNNRVQIFDQDGNFLEEWRQFGRPNDLFIDDDDVLYAADSESGDERNPEYTRGIYIGSARDGGLSAFIPPHPLDPERFASRSDVPHGTAGEGITLDADGNIYGAEVVLFGITKYTRQ